MPDRFRVAAVLVTGLCCFAQENSPLLEENSPLDPPEEPPEEADVTPEPATPVPPTPVPTAAPPTFVPRTRVPGLVATFTPALPPPVTRVPATSTPDIPVLQTIAPLTRAPATAAPPTLAPLIVQPWCENSVDCKRHGDTNAVCQGLDSGVGRCVCGTRNFENPLTSKGRAYLCLPVGQTTVSMVVTMQWLNVVCTIFDLILAGLKSAIEAIYGKGTAKNLLPVCGSLTVLAHLGDVDAASAGSIDLKSELEKEFATGRHGSRLQDLGPPDAAAATSSSGSCALPNTAITATDTRGRCNAVVCERGFAIVRTTLSSPTACAEIVDAPVDDTLVVEPWCKIGSTDCTQFGDEGATCVPGSLAFGQCSCSPGSNFENPRDDETVAHVCAPVGTERLPATFTVVFDVACEVFNEVIHFEFSNAVKRLTLGTVMTITARCSRAGLNLFARVSNVHIPELTALAASAQARYNAEVRKYTAAYSHLLSLGNPIIAFITLTRRPCQTNAATFTAIDADSRCHALECYPGFRISGVNTNAETTAPDSAPIIDTGSPYVPTESPPTTAPDTAAPDTKLPSILTQAPSPDLTTSTPNSSESPPSPAPPTNAPLSSPPTLAPPGVALASRSRSICIVDDPPPFYVEPWCNVGSADCQAFGDQGAECVSISGQGRCVCTAGSSFANPTIGERTIYLCLASGQNTVPVTVTTVWFSAPCRLFTTGFASSLTQLVDQVTGGTVKALFGVCGSINAFSRVADVPLSKLVSDVASAFSQSSSNYPEINAVGPPDIVSVSVSSGCRGVSFATYTTPDTRGRCHALECSTGYHLATEGDLNVCHKDSSDDDLSGGAIAGIVVGSVLCCLILVAAIGYALLRPSSGAPADYMHEPAAVDEPRKDDAV